MSRRRTVVVSHEASRTGAPRVAAQIASALREAGDDVRVIARWGGPLEPELRSAATRFRLERLRRIRAALRRWRPSSGFVNRTDELVAAVNLRLMRPGLVYANTAKSAAYVAPACRRGIPTVLHVHESGSLLADTLARYSLDPHDPRLRLVACADPIADELAGCLGVPRDAIEVIESHVDVSEVVTHARGDGTPPPTSGPPTVVACGLANKGKGVDHFVAVAAKVHAVRPGSFRFVWLGHVTPFAEQLLSQSTDSAVVEFLGEQANPYPMIERSDILCLPSRADSFPLVVLEAMALEKPVVAFGVGGVRRQLGDTGIVVDPGDLDAMSDALLQLLDDAHERERLGKAAGRRVRRLFDQPSFSARVRKVVDEATGRRSASDPFVFGSHMIGVRSRAARAHVTLLHAFDPSALQGLRDGSSPPMLPYRCELLADEGVEFELTDAMYHRPWTRRIVRALVRAVEGLTAPVLQTALAWRSLTSSDVVIAMFESQANSLALLRTLRVPRSRRPRLVVVSCWLARDLPRFGRVRKALYRLAYRSVDRLVFFSANQAAIFARELGMSADRLVDVTFGVDAEYFEPPSSDEGDFVVAVGRDLGRDWKTFFDAVRDSPYQVKVACRLHTLTGLEIPENVEVVGAISRERYRELLAQARLVVVATHDVEYPTGQSVLLEAMAVGKCVVVTTTAALSEYIDDGRTVLGVPPGDAQALRRVIDLAMADDALRVRIGAAGRRAVETTFNARAMWHAIGEVVASLADGQDR